MAKSDRATQDWTLATVAMGTLVEVIAVLADDPETLLVHGVRPGVRLAVDGDAPFGGPRIVRIGGARVAIDRRLASSVCVAPVLDAAAAASPGRR